MAAIGNWGVVGRARTERARAESRIRADPSRTVVTGQPTKVVITRELVEATLYSDTGDRPFAVIVGDFRRIQWARCIGTNTGKANFSIMCDDLFSIRTLAGLLHLRWSSESSPNDLR